MTLRERLARTISRRHYGSAVRLPALIPVADAAITAIAAWLDERGLQVVPKVATEKMLSNGDSMMPQIAEGEDITTGRDALNEAWPALLSAAPKFEELCK